MSKHPNDFYKFCPKCGTPYDPPHPLQCSACGYTFFINQAATASGIISDQKGRVLLTKRAIEPKKGFWDVPGGFIEYNEDPREAVVRELEEELHVRFTPIALLDVYHSIYPSQGIDVSVANIYYIGTMEGEPRPDDDVADIEWFEPAVLPENISDDHIRCAMADYTKKNVHG